MEDSWQEIELTYVVNAKLFYNTLEEILNLPLKDLKRWFLEIWTGRIASTTEDVIVDEFSHDGALKVWVGL